MSGAKDVGADEKKRKRKEEKQEKKQAKKEKKQEKKEKRHKKDRLVDTSGGGDDGIQHHVLLCFQ